MTMPPGVAFSTINAKNGRGRDTRQPEPVRHVEATACIPGRPGVQTVLHVLEADSRAQFTCRTCGRTWAELDAELNDGAKSRERK